MIFVAIGLHCFILASVFYILWRASRIEIRKTADYDKFLAALWRAERDKK